jgi:hypothetical protein
METTCALQLTENRDTAFQQRAAVRCRLDALSAPFKEADANGIFQICKRFPYGRLRNAKLGRRFSHAARLHDRKEDVHAAQLDAASDTFTPLNPHMRTEPNSYGHIR